jgi:hypothetical protein
MSQENKNQNGKIITNMKLTGKKARNLSKKKAKIEKIIEAPRGYLVQDTFQNWSFVGLSEK